MKKNKKLAMSAALFLIGLLLLFYGVHTEENKAIHNKGAVICMECIGIDGRIQPRRGVQSIQMQIIIPEQGQNER